MSGGGLRNVRRGVTHRRRRAAGLRVGLGLPSPLPGTGFSGRLLQGPLRFKFRRGPTQLGAPASGNLGKTRALPGRPQALFRHLSPCSRVQLRLQPCPCSRVPEQHLSTRAAPDCTSIGIGGGLGDALVMCAELLGRPSRGGWVK